MSRYSLRPLPHRADLFEVAVGWDPGLSTYFAIVFGVPDLCEEPEVLLWHGDKFRQVPTIEALEHVIRDLAEFAPSLVLQLAKEGGTSNFGYGPL